jgi:hypothetical protein
MVGWNVKMDKLMGTVFPYELDELDLDSQKEKYCEDRMPIKGQKWYRDDTGIRWTICWDMLTKNKPNMPSYEPRKIERTLESLDNQYNYDVYNSYYFKNYNTFIVIFNKYMDIDRFYNIIDMLNIVFDECLRTKFHLMDLIVDIPKGEKNYYVSFYYDKVANKWHTDWNNLGALKDDLLNNTYKIYPTPFRYYDIDTWEKIKSVLDTGRVNPSYKPKKTTDI